MSMHVLRVVDYDTPIRKEKGDSEITERDEYSGSSQNEHKTTKDTLESKNNTSEENGGGDQNGTSDSLTSLAAPKPLCARKRRSKSELFRLPPHLKSRKRAARNTSSSEDLKNAYKSNERSNHRSRHNLLFDRDSILNMCSKGGGVKKNKEPQNRKAETSGLSDSEPSLTQNAKIPLKLPKDTYGFKKNNRQLDPCFYQMSCHFLDIDNHSAFNILKKRFRYKQPRKKQKQQTELVNDTKYKHQQHQLRVLNSDEPVSPDEEADRYYNLTDYESAQKIRPRETPKRDNWRRNFTSFNVRKDANVFVSPSALVPKSKYCVETGCGCSRYDMASGSTSQTCIETEQNRKFEEKSESVKIERKKLFSGLLKRVKSLQIYVPIKKMTKAVMKYICLGLLVIMWSPCVLVVILVWIIMRPWRVPNLLNYHNRASSCTNNSLFNKSQPKCSVPECQRICSKYSKRRQKGVLSSVASWFTHAAANANSSIGAALSLVKLNKTRLPTCAGSTFVARHPNLKTRYNVYYAKHRGWVMKPVHHHKPYQNMRCEYSPKIRKSSPLSAKLKKRPSSEICCTSKDLILEAKPIPEDCTCTEMEKKKGQGCPCMATGSISPPNSSKKKQVNITPRQNSPRVGPTNESNALPNCMHKHISSNMNRLRVDNKMGYIPLSYFPHYCVGMLYGITTDYNWGVHGHNVAEKTTQRIYKTKKSETASISGKKHQPTYVHGKSYSSKVNVERKGSVLNQQVNTTPAIDSTKTDKLHIVGGQSTKGFSDELRSIDDSDNKLINKSLMFPMTAKPPKKILLNKSFQYECVSDNSHPNLKSVQAPLFTKDCQWNCVTEQQSKRAPFLEHVNVTDKLQKNNLKSPQKKGISFERTSKFSQTKKSTYMTQSPGTQFPSTSVKKFTNNSSCTNFYKCKSFMKTTSIRDPLDPKNLAVIAKLSSCPCDFNNSNNLPLCKRRSDCAYKKDQIRALLKKMVPYIKDKLKNINLGKEIIKISKATSTLFHPKVSTSCVCDIDKTIKSPALNKTAQCPETITKTKSLPNEAKHKVPSIRIDERLPQPLRYRSKNMQMETPLSTEKLTRSNRETDTRKQFLLHKTSISDGISKHEYTTSTSISLDEVKCPCDLVVGKRILSIDKKDTKRTNSSQLLSKASEYARKSTKISTSSLLGKDRKLPIKTKATATRTSPSLEEVRKPKKMEISTSFSVEKVTKPVIATQKKSFIISSDIAKDKTQEAKESLKSCFTRSKVKFTETHPIGKKTKGQEKASKCSCMLTTKPSKTCLQTNMTDTSQSQTDIAVQRSDKTCPSVDINSYARGNRDIVETSPSKVGRNQTDFVIKRSDKACSSVDIDSYPELCFTRDNLDTVETSPSKREETQTDLNTKSSDKACPCIDINSYRGSYSTRDNRDTVETSPSKVEKTQTNLNTKSSDKACPCIDINSYRGSYSTRVNRDTVKASPSKDGKTQMDLITKSSDKACPCIDINSYLGSYSTRDNRDTVETSPSKVEKTQTNLITKSSDKACPCIDINSYPGSYSTRDNRDTVETSPSKVEKTQTNLNTKSSDKACPCIDINSYRGSYSTRVNRDTVKASPSKDGKTQMDLITKSSDKACPCIDINSYPGSYSTRDNRDTVETSPSKVEKTQTNLNTKSSDKACPCIDINSYPGSYSTRVNRDTVKTSPSKDGKTQMDLITKSSDKVCPCIDINDQAHKVGKTQNLDKASPFVLTRNPLQLPKAKSKANQSFLSFKKASKYLCKIGKTQTDKAKTKSDDTNPCDLLKKYSKQCNTNIKDEDITKLQLSFENASECGCKTTGQKISSLFDKAPEWGSKNGKTQTDLAKEMSNNACPCVLANRYPNICKTRETEISPSFEQITDKNKLNEIATKEKGASVIKLSNSISKIDFIRTDETKKGLDKATSHHEPFLGDLTHSEHEHESFKISQNSRHHSSSKPDIEHSPYKSPRKRKSSKLSGKDSPLKSPGKQSPTRTLGEQSSPGTLCPLKTPETQSPSKFNGKYSPSPRLISATKLPGIQSHSKSLGLKMPSKSIATQSPLRSPHKYSETKLSGTQSPLKSSPIQGPPKSPGREKWLGKDISLISMDKQSLTKLHGKRTSSKSPEKQSPSKLNGKYSPSPRLISSTKSPGIRSSSKSSGKKMISKSTATQSPLNSPVKHSQMKLSDIQSSLKTTPTQSRSKSPYNLISSKSPTNQNPLKSVSSLSEKYTPVRTKVLLQNRSTSNSSINLRQTSDVNLTQPKPSQIRDQLKLSGKKIVKGSLSSHPRKSPGFRSPAKSSSRKMSSKSTKIQDPLESSEKQSQLKFSSKQNPPKSPGKLISSKSPTIQSPLKSVSSLSEKYTPVRTKVLSQNRSTSNSLIHLRRMRHQNVTQPKSSQIQDQLKLSETKSVKRSFSSHPRKSPDFRSPVKSSTQKMSSKSTKIQSSLKSSDKQSQLKLSSKRSLPKSPGKLISSKSPTIQNPLKSVSSLSEKCTPVRTKALLQNRSTSNSLIHLRRTRYHNLTQPKLSETKSVKGSLLSYPRVAQTPQDQSTPKVSKTLLKDVSSIKSLSHKRPGHSIKNLFSRGSSLSNKCTKPSSKSVTKEPLKESLKSHSYLLPQRKPSTTELKIDCLCPEDELLNKKKIHESAIMSRNESFQQSRKLSTTKSKFSRYSVRAVPSQTSIKSIIRSSHLFKDKGAPVSSQTSKVSKAKLENKIIPSNCQTLKSPESTTYNSDLLNIPSSTTLYDQSSKQPSKTSIRLALLKNMQIRPIIASTFGNNKLPWISNKTDQDSQKSLLGKQFGLSKHNLRQYITRSKHSKSTQSPSMKPTPPKGYKSTDLPKDPSVTRLSSKCNRTSKHLFGTDNAADNAATKNISQRYNQTRLPVSGKAILKNVPQDTFPHYFSNNQLVPIHCEQGTGMSGARACVHSKQAWLSHSNQNNALEKRLKPQLSNNETQTASQAYIEPPPQTPYNLTRLQIPPYYISPYAHILGPIISPCHGGGCLEVPPPKESSTHLFGCPLSKQNHAYTSKKSVVPIECKCQLILAMRKKKQRYLKCPCARNNRLSKSDECECNDNKTSKDTHVLTEKRSIKFGCPVKNGRSRIIDFECNDKNYSQRSTEKDKSQRIKFGCPVKDRTSRTIDFECNDKKYSQISDKDTSQKIKFACPAKDHTSRTIDVVCNGEKYSQTSTEKDKTQKIKFGCPAKVHTSRTMDGKYNKRYLQKSTDKNILQKIKCECPTSHYTLRAMENGYNGEEYSQMSKYRETEHTSTTMDDKYNIKKYSQKWLDKYKSLTNKCECPATDCECNSKKYSQTSLDKNKSRNIKCECPETDDKYNIKKYSRIWLDKYKSLTRKCECPTSDCECYSKKYSQKIQCECKDEQQDQPGDEALKQRSIEGTNGQADAYHKILSQKERYQKQLEIDKSMTQQTQTDPEKIPYSPSPGAPLIYRRKPQKAKIEILPPSKPQDDFYRSVKKQRIPFNEADLERFMKRQKQNLMLKQHKVKEAIKKIEDEKARLEDDIKARLEKHKKPKLKKHKKRKLVKHRKHKLKIHKKAKSHKHKKHKPKIHTKKHKEPSCWEQLKEGIRESEEQAWPLEVTCNPIYIHTLKRKPHLWLFRLCPAMYPHFLNVSKVHTYMLQALMYIITGCLCCPVFLCFYYCGRALLCGP